MDLFAESPMSACYMDETREVPAISDISHVSTSVSVPKISDTTDSIANAIDKELGVHLHSNLPSGISSLHDQTYFNKKSHSTSHPVIVKPLYSDEPIQFSSKEEENEEKSAYEIAVEALCLMKQSGGKIPSSVSQLSSEEYCKPSVFSDGSVDLTVESEVVIDSRTDQSGSFENEAKESTGNTDSSSLNRVNTSKKIVKYVLVPETAIISAENSSNVSKMGMPVLYMVPQGDGTQQKVYKLARPQPRVIKLKKKAVPPSVESTLSMDDQNNLLQRSDLEQLNSISIQSSLVSRNEDSSSDGISIESKTKSIRGKRHMSKKHDTLKFPPCIICTGEASGLHYGCNTCEACKNFFRRCLLRKSSTPFICHGNNCEISFKKNKNNCSACRLKKCLEAGMAKEKCKMGRYTALMRTETIKKVRKLEGKDSDFHTVIGDESMPIPGTSHHVNNSDKPHADQGNAADMYANMFSKDLLSEISDTDSQTMTEFNSDMIIDLVSAMHEIQPFGKDLCTHEARYNACKQHYEKYQAKLALFGSMTEVSMSEYHNLLKNFGIDIDGQWQSFKEISPHWDHVVRKYCAFMKHVPTFSALEYEDQACLLKATHCDFFTVLSHQGYVHEFGVFLEANGQPFHINEAGDKFMTKALIVLMCDLACQLQKMNLLDSELALLVSIISMSPDRCQLKNPNLVETTQLRLTDLLFKQLRKTYGHVKGRQRFTTFIDILIKMRECSHLYMKEYRTLCNDEMIKKDVPDVDVCLPEED